MLDRAEFPIGFVVDTVRRRKLFHGFAAMWRGAEVPQGFMVRRRKVLREVRWWDSSGVGEVTADEGEDGAFGADLDGGGNRGGSLDEGRGSSSTSSSMGRGLDADRRRAAGSEGRRHGGGDGGRGDRERESR